MKKITKKLLIILFIIIIFKIILSSFVLSPSAFSDEYTYSKMARSFFYNQNFNIHDTPTRQYLPFYPIILSISYLFQDMQIIYFFMKVLNSILSSLILIPAFLLTREFLSEKKALITALLISFYPANFSFSPLIMAENLYYPLFLLTVYFIYKTFTENHYKWSILTGISLGLTILTKINGIIFIPVIGILYLYKIKKREFKLKKAFLLGTSLVIVMLLWIIRNTILFGFSITSILGGYSAYLEETTFSFPSFLLWIVIYTGIIIISTGFIYFLLNLVYSKKNEKLMYLRLITLLSAIFVVIIAANSGSHSAQFYTTLIKWLTWRPVTRTIDVIAPLIIINGLINLNNIDIKKITLPLFTLISSILLITSQIVFFKLFPFNNMSLVLLGITSSIVQNIFTNQMLITIIFTILFISILLFIYYLYKKDKINFKNLALITILFFLISGITNYGLIGYNANKYWYENNQMQISMWFNKYDQGKSTVLIDDRDESRILKIDQKGLYERNQLNNTVTKIGFFMNNKILIGNVNNLDGIDYIISKHKLNLEIIKNINNIYIYKAHK